VLKRTKQKLLVTVAIFALAICHPISYLSNAYAKDSRTKKSVRVSPVGKAKPTKSKGSYKKIRSFKSVPIQEPKDIRLSKNYSAALERVEISATEDGRPSISSLPRFGSLLKGKVAGISPKDDIVFYSIDPELQRFAEALVAQAAVPHAAVVAMEPRTGRILAIAEKSSSIKDLALHAGFPAASLFKLVTTAAALEKGAIQPDSIVNFRGGNYSLNEWNYIPNARLDRRHMNVAEALGKSVNPVFARIALSHLDSSTLRAYANTFGFNTELSFDSPLEESNASIPYDDYGLSRTAAGFGEVRISPVHAAAMMSGIANNGLMPRPSLIDRVVRKNGSEIYIAKPQFIKRIIRPETSSFLLRMMEATTTIGTSRKEFMRKNMAVLPGIPVAAKTGTLKGDNPEGLNNWFIAAAPSTEPRIAVSVIVVSPQGLSTKASHLGRLLIQKYLLG